MAADNTCDATVTWMPPTATDNCGIKSIAASHDPGTKFPIGITRVVYEAIDVNDNRSFCQFDVAVENRTPPVITNCPADIVIKANEDGTVAVKWDEPLASVNCGTVKLESSHDPNDVFEVGTTVVEYTATDEAGLTTTCTFNVIVSFEELQFDIAKVITPDGNAVNDRWILGNIEKFRDNRVVIVDRWGSVIFSGVGYDNERVVWRGTNSKGEVVPTGTYFYTIVVSYRDRKLEKKGFIELIN
jgi:gliding motility-associated-like protein